jgi:hypothetical protein
MSPKNQADVELKEEMLETIDRDRCAIKDKLVPPVGPKVCRCHLERESSSDVGSNTQVGLKARLYSTGVCPAKVNFR